MYQLIVKKSFPFRGNPAVKVGASMHVEKKLYDYLMKKWGTEYLEVKKGPNEHQIAAQSLKESPEAEATEAPKRKGGLSSLLSHK